MTDAIVVMGVSGSGKSTLARALADALGWRFVEGDELHPPANVAKMAAGIPLDDADRIPFLLAVARALRGGHAVAACSALKRSYRDLIRAEAGAVTFVLPAAQPAVVAARLATRTGHFMPASLLASQFATLEPPAPDEGSILVDAALPVAEQVAAVLVSLKIDPPPPGGGGSAADGGGGRRHVLERTPPPAPSDAIGATSPWRGRIE